MADESVINGGSGHRAQRMRVKKNGWTKARRTAFLKALAETCNVSLSTERAGMGHTSVYAVRHRDPVFARLWDDALAIGYDRLEASLLQRAIDGVNDIDLPAEIDAAAPEGGKAAEGSGNPMARGRRIPGSGVAQGLARTDIQLGLALLNRRGPKRGLLAGARKLMSSDEVDALLTKKLDALARRLNRG